MSLTGFKIFFVYYIPFSEELRESGLSLPQRGRLIRPEREDKRDGFDVRQCEVSMNQMDIAAVLEKRRAQLALKRAMDIVISAGALLVLWPLLLGIELAIRLDEPGPVFYRALRGGYHNKPFYIMKFRSMVVDADKTGGCTALNDSRVTRAGKVMRRLKLDELPQLFNILKGDMSFVGPRPELLLYTTQYTPEQECILWVRPGITDRSSIVYIAQDELVGEENPVENFEKYILPEKNRLRVEYAKSQCFTLDMQLFFETIGGVFGKAKKMAGEKAGQKGSRNA